MNEPITRIESLDAAKKFCNLGLDFTWLPLLSTPHACAIWTSRVERNLHTLNDAYNVGVRGRRDECGAFTAFAVTLQDEPNYGIRMHETAAYRLLSGIPTLRFEAGSTASFVFRCDKHITVSEHGASGEPILCQPLKGARLALESGWLAFGAVHNYGRYCQVTCEGDKIANVREFPVLLDALKRTGRFRVQVDSSLLTGPISGAPLL